MGNKPCSGSQGASLQIRSGVWKNRKICYRTDRLVVKLSPAAARLVADPVMLLQDILDAVPGAICLRGPGRSGRVVIGVPDGTDVLAITSQLDFRDDVEYAEPDIIDAAVDENKPKGGM